MGVAIVAQEKLCRGSRCGCSVDRWRGKCVGRWMIQVLSNAGMGSCFSEDLA